mgnify:CR=1 FL=1
MHALQTWILAEPKLPQRFKTPPAFCFIFRMKDPVQQPFPPPERGAFGKGTIMRLGADSPALAIDVIPTGSLSLDLALGVGGIPRGRVIASGRS